MKWRKAELAAAAFQEKRLILSSRALGGLLRAVLDKGVPFRLRAHGRSMSPFIRDGDIITVVPCTGDSLRRGDVAAFIHPQREGLVVHRVSGKAKDKIFLKGDNSHMSDGPVPRKDILGRVVRIERNGKKAFLGLGPERLLIPVLTRPGLRSCLRPLGKILSHPKKV